MDNESIFLAAALRPLLLLILFIAILYPARRCVERFMPESRFKRLLLWRTNNPW
jgi:hypothetical protein